MPQHGSIHDSLYNAFSFGLFAAYELESEDRELLQKLISGRRAATARPPQNQNRAPPTQRNMDYLLTACALPL
jgi:hypothetical protein